MSLPPPPATLLVTEDILQDLVGRFVVMVDSGDKAPADNEERKEDSTDVSNNKEASNVRDETDAKNEEGVLNSKSDAATTVDVLDGSNQVKDMTESKTDNGEQKNVENPTSTNEDNSIDPNSSNNGKDQPNEKQITDDNVDIEKIEITSNPKENDKQIEESNIELSGSEGTEKVTDKEVSKDDENSLKCGQETDMVIEKNVSEPETEKEQEIKDKSESMEDTKPKEGEMIETAEIKPDAKTADTENVTQDETITETKDEISAPEEVKPKKVDIKSKPGKVDKKLKGKKSIRKTDVESDREKEMPNESKTKTDIETSVEKIHDSEAIEKSKTTFNSNREADVEEKIVNDPLHEVGEKNQEDDIAKPEGDGLIEDQKMKNDIEEAIIDIESTIDGQDDFTKDEYVYEEKEHVPLRRQGSIKAQIRGTNEESSLEEPSYRSFHVSPVEEYKSTEKTVAKVKFNIAEFEETSGGNSSQALTSTMSNILITYQVGPTHEK